MFQLKVEVAPACSANHITIYALFLSAEGMVCSILFLSGITGTQYGDNLMAKVKQRNQPRKGWLSQLLLTLSLIFLAFGLFQLGWAVWPIPRDAVQIVIRKGVLPGAPAGKAYESLAEYTLSLSWPIWFRAEQTENIQLAMIEAEALNDPQTTGREGQIVIFEPVMSNLTLTPPGRIQTNLAAGKELDLIWDVEGEEAGETQGNLYVAFGFYDDALEEVVPVPVAVLDINTRIVSLWGLGVNLVIWLGFMGLVLWGALFVLGRLAQGH